MYLCCTTQHTHVFCLTASVQECSEEGSRFEKVTCRLGVRVKELKLDLLSHAVEDARNLLTLCSRLRIKL
jgi:hypothetical protein